MGKVRELGDYEAASAGYDPDAYEPAPDNTWEHVKDWLDEHTVWANIIYISIIFGISVLISTIMYGF